jgi:hypothetical protein
VYGHDRRDVPLRGCGNLRRGANGEEQRASQRSGAGSRRWLVM